MQSARFNSVHQLAVVMAGFTLTILLLEANGLAQWAERLDVGPARQAAVTVTEAINRAVHPLGVEVIRSESLTGLARLGWSDDPASLAAARRSLLGDSTRACSVAPMRSPLAPRPLAPVSVATPVPLQTALPPLPLVASGQTRTVVLVGDSMMAVGLSDVLLRATADDPHIRMIKAFRSGTGLARPDVFDWMQEYPAMLGDEHPDVIVVAIGANDGQGFVDRDKVLAFGSDAWVKVYQRRVAAFLGMLTQDGARVVWMGLPPMKSAQYNARIAEINRIAYAEVSEFPQAVWWNPAPYVGDAAGGYREFETAANGRSMRLRAPDGIHLSDDGAALFAPVLVKWLTPAPPLETAQINPPAVPHPPLKKPRAGFTQR